MAIDSSSPDPPPPPSFERIDSVDEKLREHPCFLFITRPDLYNYAKVQLSYNVKRFLAGLMLVD